HGGSHPNPGPLTFTIDNITTSDFTINNKTANGYIFATDICTQRGAGSGCSGITGDVVASDAPAPSPIPEPATLLHLADRGIGIRSAQIPPAAELTIAKAKTATTQDTMLLQ